jgi:hypothetical protein
MEIRVAWSAKESGKTQNLFARAATQSLRRGGQVEEGLGLPHGRTLQNAGNT